MRILALFAAILLLAPTSSAQDTPAAELIQSIQGAEAKFAALAESLSDDALAWRPAEGVRSSHEVLRHVAAANYMLPSFMGVLPPEGAPIQVGAQGPQGVQEFEAGTDRAVTQAEIEASFAHLTKALSELTEEQLAEEVTFFGRTASVRGFGTFMSTHMHEHLGQLIAYTRANGETPPWSTGG
ncbi:MAG: hypothetical protein Rubg2KO_26170 [Rubricoccaceae bacterium]